MFDDFIEFQTMLGTRLCIRRHDVLLIEEIQRVTILFTSRATFHINHTYEEAIKIAGIKVNNGNQDN